ARGRRHAGARLHARGRGRRRQEDPRPSMMRRSQGTGGSMRSHVTKLLLTLALVLGGASLAADLPRFLPSETLFAFGVEGLSAHEAKARPFIDEWERLDLTALLEAAFAEEVGEEAPDVPAIGAGFLDLPGRGAGPTAAAAPVTPAP